MIGQTVGHYDIEARLGGGGMGVVYRARDRKLGRLVALKFLSPHLTASERAKQRFVTEARAASALDHPAIATIHAIEETPAGELYIVMAYYEGETVAARIARQGVVPVGQALDLAIQAGEGLACAHEQGIVHRDVKPANLMITADGRVKVLDFGLAKVEDVRLTDAGTTLGTPAYMSPEQARGAAVNHRTDIWSLGVVLYELLSGRLPFPGESREEVIDAILRASPAAPGHWAAVPPDLEAIVLRALRREPDARQRSMAALVQELRAVRQDRVAASSADTLAQPAALPAAPSAARTSAAPSGERRSVTVLACDLADVLSLSEQLDPEELHSVLSRCHEIGSAVVRSLEGHVGKAEEGRVVGYFGYPVAHEDDAQRAVRAALGIAEALRREGAPRGPGGATLVPRAGIHTGVMVAGDARSSAAGLVGNVPAIAARILDAALPGSVVLSAETRPLVERSFVLESGGEQAVPGLRRPLALARVLRETGERTSGVGHAALTPLVGRDEDVSLVLARFEMVREGQGQVVLLTGEPGIGKSRLLLEVRERLRSTPLLALECRASPFHTSDALRPVADMLARLAGLGEGQDPADERARLARALEALGATPETVGLLAAALSLPADGAPPDLTPQRRRQKTLEALVQLVLAAAARRPVLLAVEDLHWLDPSSDEVLAALVRECAGAAVLVIATARPGTTPAWADEEHVTRLALRRLSRRQTESLVAQVAGAAGLPAAVVEQVLGRTDGIPLFAEELTRALCDVAGTGADGTRPSVESLAALVPATLQESLAARLDRLGPAKATAQLASVLGREFPLRWLEAVSPLSGEALREELDRLVGSGLLQTRGHSPAGACAFKHALVQEAAYASLLKTTRQQYHARVAQALEERFAEAAAAEPHLVAHHHAEAGHAALAVEWWSRAAERAGARFASREAAASLGKALDVLATLPEGPERDGRELALQMGLCTHLPSVCGYAHDDTERAYRRAAELCDSFGPAAGNFWVYHGLWAFHFVRARLAQARERAAQIEALGRARGDTLSVLDGHYAQGVTLAFLGEHEAALAHLEQGMAKDAADPSRAASYLAGMEVGVTTPAYSVMPLWLLGRADAALERAVGAAGKARAGGHPLTLAFALNYVAWAHRQRGEAVLAAERARELVSLSVEHGLFFAPLGGVSLGWALDQEAPLVPAWHAPSSREPGTSGPGEEGLDRVASGLQFYRATGSLVNLTDMLSLLALAHARRGRWAEARAALDEALAFAAETGEVWWTSELWRLHGEVALAAAGGGGDRAPARREAEAAFLRAGEIAAGQKALALELRAATSLARLRRDEGQPAEARARLEPVLARFTEGHATGDLVAARGLLGELA
jgi:serine/threonine protein kinase/tetratricopeptide (TPR) repeat protein